MTSRSGLSLSRMPSWRMVCDGRDEGAPDVGVLDQPLAVGDAGLLRVADRGRRARLRRRHHQVGVDRVLARQGAAHLDPGLVHAPAVDRGVGAGQVDVLEDAALGRRLGEALRAQAVLVDGDELARLDLADRARRRRCRAPRSRRRRPSRARAGRGPAGGCRAGRGAAYRVCSSMKTKQKAPRSRGSTSRAAASRERSGSSASSAVTSAVSVVLPRAQLAAAWAPSPRRPSTRSRSSAELVRLPLWASATVPPAWPPRVGWAFSQVEPPVVE